MCLSLFQACTKCLSVISCKYLDIFSMSVFDCISYSDEEINREISLDMYVTICIYTQTSSISMWSHQIHISGYKNWDLYQRLISFHSLIFSYFYFLHIMKLHVGIFFSFSLFIFFFPLFVFSSSLVLFCSLSCPNVFIYEDMIVDSIIIRI